MINTGKLTLQFALTVVLTGYLGLVSAWTDDLDKLKDVNTLCKFEPAAQCSWAVRVGAKAAGLDMHESSMASIRFDKADLSRSNLSYSILQLASLKGANLMMANLEGAHMHAVNLEGANLMMANLMKVNLLDANLTGANLRGANLTDAIIIKAKFDNATWTDGRICAVGSVGECR
ncbi:MAG: pentapeptide repeat-containing protein [Gammaproteobacteria bacterium]|nr:pentapeptide repeat-containing protein [Gammaproteobacteria bacterium]